MNDTIDRDHQTRWKNTLTSFLFRVVRDGDHVESLRFINTLPFYGDLVEDSDGETLLHALLEGSQCDHETLALAETLLKISPWLAMKPNGKDETPLLLAMCLSRQNSLGTKLSIMMISQCVESVGTERTSQGHIMFSRHWHLVDPFEHLFAEMHKPKHIHIACVVQCDSEVLHFMLQVDPSLAVSLCMVSIYGYDSPISLVNPIMLLCHAYRQNDLPIDKISIVLETAFSESIDGKLVHLACQYHMFVQSFECIVSRFPDQVFMKDEYGDLPLHYALRGEFLAVTNQKKACQYQESISRLLIAKYPAASNERDRYGLLPLEIALWRGVSECVIVELLNASPASVTMTRSNGLNLFAIASIAIKDQYSAVNMSYKLLRMNPNALNH